jgi:non-homologous end joining protein Ku
MPLQPYSPYYLVPDGEVGQPAFAVIRGAIRKEGMMALGRVVFTSREHAIAPAKVINLMDALRRSVEAERGGGGRGEQAAASGQTPKKAARSNARKRTG